MSREQTARCPRCYNVTGLRDDGTFRNHRGGGAEVLCPEAGKRPPAQVASREARASRDRHADTDTCPECGIRQKNVASARCSACKGRRDFAESAPQDGGRDYPLTVTDPSTGASRVVVIRAASYADAIKKAMTR